jgi:hypothetical protein
MCLATALKNNNWPSNNTHGTSLTSLPFWLTTVQRNIIVAALNIFSKGGSYDDVDEPLSLLHQAIELYEKSGDEDGKVACESVLVDCLMVDYTYKRTTENLTRATEMFRKFLTCSVRDNRECRGWDGIRYGTLCVKRFCDEGRVPVEDLDLLIEKTEGYRENDDQMRWIVEIVQKLRDYITS